MKAICLMYYKRKKIRASRTFIFSYWAAPSKGRRHLDYIHRNNCIRHGIVSGGRRFRPRGVGAVEEV